MSTHSKSYNKKQLPVHEIFYSIQGEGYHTGKPAIFIRLAGCQVGCYWCDTKESWDLKHSTLMNNEEIFKKIKNFQTEVIIFTGGEPLANDLSSVTGFLKKKNYILYLETSGAYPLRGKWDWICLSPKKFQIPQDKIFNKVNELKIIIYNKSDFEWAKKNADKVNQNCHLYLQPEWSKREKILPLIVDYIKNNPQWKLSLQIHKIIGIQ